VLIDCFLEEGIEFELRFYSLAADTLNE